MAGNVPGIDPKLTAMTIQELRTAKANGQITTEQYTQILEFKQEQAEQGTKVEHKKDRPLTPAQQARKEKIEQQKKDQEAAMKEVAKLQQELADMKAKKADEASIAAKQGELDAAQKKLDEVSRPIVVRDDGVDAKGVKIDTDNGEKGTAAVADLKAPTEKMEKHTRRQEKAEMARYYDEETGKWIEAERDENGELRTDKEALRQVKRDLKAKEDKMEDKAKAAKKEAKASVKDFRQALADFRKAQIDHEQGKMNDEEFKQKSDAFLKAEADFVAKQQARGDSIEELAQVKQARKASQGKGIRGDKRAYNRDVKANNRIVDRQVFYSQEDADAAIAAGADKKDVKVATDKDLEVLAALQVAGKNGLKASGESLEAQGVWQELATLLVDENGNPTSKPDTKKIQNALMDLTGGDMKLDYTEQQMLQNETHLSNSQIRHLFETYGFDAPNPLGKRITNGFKEAVPVLATMGLAAYLSKHKVKSEATATAEAEATATATATAEATATATAHAEAWTEDVINTFVDQFGRTRDQRIAGQFAEDTQTVTQTATKTTTATSTSKAFGTATALAEAAAGLTPLAIIAAPALAFLTGFFKNPVESSAVKGATTEKMATYVDVFNKNKNKNIGNQIIQMTGQITGDEALDKLLIVSVLDHDIGAQNTVPTTRELRMALEHLQAIQEQVKKTTVEVPTEPVPSPSPVDDRCDTIEANDVITTYHYDKKGGDSWGGIVDALYPDCLTNHTRAEVIRELKRQLATDENGVLDQAKFRELLKANDLPKAMDLPAKLFDCDIKIDGVIQPVKIIPGRGRVNAPQNAGRGFLSGEATDCDGTLTRGKSGADAAQKARNNPRVKPDATVIQNETRHEQRRVGRGKQ